MTAPSPSPAPSASPFQPLPPPQAEDTREESTQPVQNSPSIVILDSPSPQPKANKAKPRQEASPPTAVEEEEEESEEESEEEGEEEGDDMYEDDASEEAEEAAEEEDAEEEEETEAIAPAKDDNRPPPASFGRKPLSTLALHDAEPNPRPLGGLAKPKLGLGMKRKRPELSLGAPVPEPSPAAAAAAAAAAEREEVRLSQQEETRRTTLSQLQNHNLVVHRAPILPGLKVVPLRKQFTAPTQRSDKVVYVDPAVAAMRKGRSLGIRRRPGSGMKMGTRLPSAPIILQPQAPTAVLADENDGSWEPLVLWEGNDKAGEEAKVEVPSVVAKILRPHQREGVQFMFECVSGMREAQVEGYTGRGSILADDMGLGKTLQSISLMYTCLSTHMPIDPAAQEDDIADEEAAGGEESEGERRPMVQKAIVVCPTSLVKNWDCELDKWLAKETNTARQASIIHPSNRCALCECDRAKAIKEIDYFLKTKSMRIMIISYETYRIHAERWVDTQTPSFSTPPPSVLSSHVHIW